MSCCGVMDFGHGDVHSPMCYMIWILRNILWVSELVELLRERKKEKEEP